MAPEKLRQSLRRANTAVGIILLTALLLTVTAVIAGFRAVGQQRLAEQAEAEGRQRLWNAYLTQARAARLSGSRREALMSVSNAAALRISTEVRDEVIACEALTDLTIEREVCPVLAETPLVEFAPGLEKYAIGSEEGDFRICRTRDATELFHLSRTAAGLGPALGRDRRVWAYEFSPDANYFALSLRDGALAVWELASGRIVFQHLPKAAGEIEIRFSQDSTLFGFHDVDRGKDLAMVALPAGRVREQTVSLAGAPFTFLPDTNQLAVAVGNEIRILRLDTKEVLQTVTTPETVTSLLASPDGRKLAATSAGTDLCLWNLDARQLYVLRSHTERNFSFEFTPASDRLMSSSLDNVTFLWDCAGGRELLRAMQCNGLDFSADGQQVGCLVERRRLALYRLAGGSVFRTLAGRGPRDQPIVRADLSSSGRWLAAVLDAGVEIWDLQSEQPGQFFPMEDARALTFHPDGKSILLCRAGRLEQIEIESPSSNGNSAEEHVRLGSPRSLALPRNASVRHVALSQDGRTACLDLADRSMVVVDLASQRTNVVLNAQPRYTFRVGAASGTGSGRYAVSGAGRWIAAGYGPANQPVIFDARSGQISARLAVPAGTVVFSHDDQWLLTSGGNVYSLWRVSDWQLVWQRSFDALANQWGCMSFSGDDRWVALTLDRHRIGLLDALTGETLTTLEAPHLQTIAGLRIASDNARLVATTFNNLAQVWELSSLREHLRPLGFDYVAPLPSRASVALGNPRFTPGSTTILALGLAAFASLCGLTLAILARHRRLAEEFVQAEAHASERERELQVQRELNKFKSNFISMVSHEFRTPLGVIQSSAEILQAYLERLKPERRAEHLNDIVQSTTRMKDLMEEVLLLGRVESGRMECRLGPVDLPLLARRLADEISASTENRCPIKIDTSDCKGETRLDESLISIILANLLSNAIKYSPAGVSVLLSIRREAHEIVLAVRDEGIGIPLADQASLFKSFHRASNVAQIPGSGLGLTIVKRCSELHGGTVSFTSAEGRGTTFVVRLPA